MKTLEIVSNDFFGLVMKRMKEKGWQLIGEIRTNSTNIKNSIMSVNVEFYCHPYKEGIRKTQEEYFTELKQVADEISRISPKLSN